MTDSNTHGEAELDAYMKVARVGGTIEYYRVVNQVNVPITVGQYVAATQEG